MNEILLSFLAGFLSFFVIAFVIYILCLVLLYLEKHNLEWLIFVPGVSFLLLYLVYLLGNDVLIFLGVI